MADDRDAAAALAHMPRWVAVHENTLAKLDVIVATAGSYGHDVDVVLSEIDEARTERDRAVGIAPDAAPAAPTKGETPAAPAVPVPDPYQEKQR